MALGNGDLANVDLISYHQRPEEAGLVPTGMEATVTIWFALKLYSAFVYGAPTSFWDEMMAWDGSSLIGNVHGIVKDSNGDPISDATVAVVDGTQSGTPQSLTSYVDRGETGDDGRWTIRFGGAGTKTVYVVKDGHKYLCKTYTFAQDDQNVEFPDAVLTA